MISFNREKLSLIAGIAIRYSLFPQQNHSLQDLYQHSKKEDGTPKKAQLLQILVLFLPAIPFHVCKKKVTVGATGY